MHRNKTLLRPRARGQSGRSSSRSQSQSALTLHEDEARASRAFELRQVARLARPAARARRETRDYVFARRRTPPRPPNLATWLRRRARAIPARPMSDGDEGQRDVCSNPPARVASRGAGTKAHYRHCLLVHLHRRDAGHGHVHSRGRRTVGQSRVGQSPSSLRFWWTSGSGVGVLFRARGSSRCGIY